MKSGANFFYCLKCLEAFEADDEACIAKGALASYTKSFQLVLVEHVLQN